MRCFPTTPHRGSLTACCWGQCWGWRGAASLYGVSARGEWICGREGAIVCCEGPLFASPLLAHNEACERGVQRGGVQRASISPLPPGCCAAPAFVRIPFPLVRRPIMYSDVYTVPTTLTDGWTIFQWFSATAVFVFGWLHITWVSCHNDLEIIYALQGSRLDRTCWCPHVVDTIYLPRNEMARHTQQVSKHLDEYRSCYI
ncbi:hypothetical protein BJY52DRAFT_92867 [Lactarius psammicola]|nr:hypothetical protein BJY52DRAFT_92867 [Lactarius psammicola]